MIVNSAGLVSTPYTCTQHTPMPMLDAFEPADSGGIALEVQITQSNSLVVRYCVEHAIQI